ncbi:MAG: HDOD domain-containing protein [Desulfopila sp.]|jgi:HD-like signal output (HDOD) protein|nr:HDOD domain-containing protein [Desulfopila sp.]
MSTSARKIIRKFNNIKTLPHVVTRLSVLINDEESTMKDFEDVIKMDPTLVVRLLRLVNSPYYGLAQKVDSISRAVAFIGMKNLYSLAVTDALKNIFTSTDNDSSIYSRKQLWMHCAAVSICSKVLAERLFGINGEDAYLCGILHDFGIIVEEQVAPQAFLKACETYDRKTSIDAFERELLGTDHCEIGYLLTKEWQMAEDIQVAIRDHHLLLEEVVPESLTGIIQLAEYLTAQLGYTALQGATVTLSPDLVEHIQENMDEYEVLLEDLPEEMEKAQDLYGFTQVDK